MISPPTWTGISPYSGHRFTCRCRVIAYGKRQDRQLAERRRQDMGQRRRYFQRIWRLIKLRLLVPLMRSPHPPEYTAWGTAVGLAWAFTPTPGIQMLLVLATWMVGRTFHWH